MSSVDEAVKLEKLAIDEVSGVDRPANLLDGWMVAKAAGPGYPLGPDQSWDVSAAEKRIRTAAGAEDAPTAKYASCFLAKSGDGTNFGDYKFLVCDVVDGDIKVMPQAIRAAASRLSGSSLSDSEKASVQKKINALESKAGIGDAAEKSSEEATSLLTKIKDLVFPGTSPEEGVEMTPEEMDEALEKRLAPITEAVEGLVSKSVEAAPATEGATETEAESEAVTIDQVTKAITDGITAALEPYNEILEKVLDRVEAAEKRQGFGTRKSLDGQESNAADEDATPPTPTVEDAILKALRNPNNPVATAAFAGDKE